MSLIFASFYIFYFINEYLKQVCSGSKFSVPTLQFFLTFIRLHKNMLRLWSPDLDDFFQYHWSIFCLFSSICMYVSDLVSVFIIFFFCIWFSFYLPNFVSLIKVFLRFFFSISTDFGFGNFFSMTSYWLGVALRPTPRQRFTRARNTWAPRLTSG